MDIRITLSSGAGVLDTREVSVLVDDDTAEISNAIWNAIDDWVLTPGDTIRITEVEE